MAGSPVQDQTAPSVPVSHPTVGHLAVTSVAMSTASENSSPELSSRPAL